MGSTCVPRRTRTSTVSPAWTPFAKLGIVNANPHDALADCIAEAEVYHTLLRMF